MPAKATGTPRIDANEEVTDNTESGENEPRVIQNPDSERPMPVGLPVGVPFPIDVPVIAQQVTAGSTPPVVDVNNAPLRKNFLILTGYKVSDIIGFNEASRIFVTSNGGKYQLSKKGTQVKVLSGPNPPSLDEDKDA